VIDGELSWAVGEARRAGADRAALSDVILKLAGEVRQQLGLQLQITRTLIDLREFREFRQTVIDVLSQESPATGQRLSPRSRRDTRCGRASICCRRSMTREDPMRLSRDLLGELIADLERALPRVAEAGTYTVRPTLEDFQAVLTPLLFAPKADRQRIFADPQYQCL
jgi:hypothetical protein